ncbi:MAG: DNA polymerase III subunit delta' C-terminal domain-containing protein, partial [Trichococcus flocculiformis]
KNPQAFVFVQTDLMDGLKDKNDGHFFLDLLLFYYRDLLYTKYSNKQAIVNKNHGTEYERIAEKLHPQEITRHMENILKGKKHLEANVQLQGVLEEIALGNSL